MSHTLVYGWWKVREKEMYPGVVEFGLQGDVFAFFLVLRAQDLQLGGLERAGVVFVSCLCACFWRGWAVRRTIPHLRRLLRVLLVSACL